LIQGGTRAGRLRFEFRINPGISGSIGSQERQIDIFDVFDASNQLRPGSGGVLANPIDILFGNRIGNQRGTLADGMINLRKFVTRIFFQIDGAQIPQFVVIHARTGNGNRISCDGILFKIGDLLVKPVGKGKNQGDADDADTAGKGREERPAQFRPDIIKRRDERRPEGHRRFFEGEFRLHPDGFCDGMGVRNDFSILQTDDAGSIFVGEFGVMGNHND